MEMQNKKYYKLINHALEYVEDNYPDFKLRLKTLSIHLGVSAIHLGRIFIKYNNVNPTDYHNV